MTTFGRGLMALVACSMMLIGCGGSGSGSSDEVGSSCFGADAGTPATDCGSLTCFCIRGDVPGVCSKACSKDSDCASFGDDMSCAIDFCTGVNVCLRGYSRSTGP
ncbi:MAG: hypothetical protein ACMG6S_20615 [Byssovorax sp.]